jgi:hypothetical protein
MAVLLGVCLFVCLFVCLSLVAFRRNQCAADEMCSVQCSLQLLLIAAFPRVTEVLY